MDDKDKKEVKGAWWQPAVSICVQITGWIAAPIIIALFLGKWLDEKYGTQPWFFLGLMLAAFIITSVGIARVSISYIKKIEQEAKRSQKSENKKLDNND
ncbi:MAG TPA: AtpZ/AtpI family protein [Patescibacteria group bacterium]|nr:AtpZ/AtpI family protein [Patescibacteria group bacterium]